MIRTRISWDNIKLHFTYTWWAYAVMAAMMIFVWTMSYHATEYEPPADKKLQITFAGDFVASTVLEEYHAMAVETFPELEKITVDNIPISFTGEGDFSGFQKLQVVIAVGEGDLYLMSDDLMRNFGDMAAFAPLDALVQEGGALYGMFTEEELARGTFTATDGDGQPHLYGIPTDRFNGLLGRGVNTAGCFLTMTSYTQNPVYAEKALVWLCEETKMERPAWLDEMEKAEEENGENSAGLPEIG